MKLPKSKKSNNPNKNAKKNQKGKQRRNVEGISEGHAINGLEKKEELKKTKGETQDAKTKKTKTDQDTSRNTVSTYIKENNCI